MVSAVDFTPTVLDIIEEKINNQIQGRSFLPLMLGKSQSNRDHVFIEYNESSSGYRHPMRSIRTQKYGYIFNPWANGTRKFSSATTNTISYRTMKSVASKDSVAAQRLKLFDYRCLEEFYDYEKDPNALNNLINNPLFKVEIDKHRALLEKWMIDTDDHCLLAFQKRYDAEFVNQYIESKQKESDARRNSDVKKKKMNIENQSKVKNKKQSKL
jgi:N-sulfoglucosamine sulfohydrolase